MFKISISNAHESDRHDEQKPNFNPKKYFILSEIHKIENIQNIRYSLYSCITETETRDGVSYM